MMGRATTEIAMHLLGGQHRLVPSNMHQVRVIICVTEHQVHVICVHMHQVPGARLVLSVHQVVVMCSVFTKPLPLLQCIV